MMRKLLARLLIGALATLPLPDALVAQVRAPDAPAPDLPRRIGIVAPPIRSDSVEVGDSRGERAAAGALAGAAAGVVMSVQDRACAPDDSPVQAGLIGAALGALRAAFGGERQAPPVRPHPPRDPGPFPFEQDECEPSSDDLAQR